MIKNFHQEVNAMPLMPEVLLSARNALETIFVSWTLLDPLGELQHSPKLLSTLRGKVAKVWRGRDRENMGPLHNYQCILLNELL